MALQRLRRSRPSGMATAEHCSASVWLADKHPEESVATRKGDDADGLVTLALMGVQEPTPDKLVAIALLMWVRSEFPGAKFYPQHRVTVYDPKTGEELTAGTADLLVVFEVEGRKRLVVIDWKTMGQFWAGYIKKPDDSPQQIAYMLGGGMEFEVDEAQIVLVLFNENKLKVQAGDVHPAHTWQRFADRIKAMPLVDLDGPQPIASKGDHCDHCWQKRHCSAYLLPGMQEMPTALLPFSGEGSELSEVQASAGLAWVVEAKEAMKRAKAVVEVVEEQLKTYARLHGQIPLGERVWGPHTTSPKRKGLTVAQLEDLGLNHHITYGEPGEEFDFRKAFVPLTEVTKGKRAKKAPAPTDASPAEETPPPAALARVRGRALKVIGPDDKPYPEELIK